MTAAVPTLDIHPVYWGPRTAQALASFDVHGVRLSSVPLLVVALATVTDAAARTNLRLGRLSRPVATAVSAACREVVDGRWLEQFVVDVRHGGSPREVQANADEVLAGRARVLRRADDGGPVDVTDLDAAVDLHPVSLRLAVIMAAHDLLEHLRRLRRELRRRAEALGEALTTDDPVLVALRGRLGGYASDVAAQQLHLEETLVELHQVPLTATDASRPTFAATLVEELSAATGLGFGVVDGEPDAQDVPARPARSLLTLSRALKPLAVRLAQVWSGLSTLAHAAGLPTPDGQRRRSEVVNRTALDVIGAVLLDEVREADAPGRRVESAITFSVLDSMAKLGEATGAVADWCREGLDPAQPRLAA